MSSSFWFADPKMSKLGLFVASWSCFSTPALILYKVHIFGEEHSGMQSAQDMTVDKTRPKDGVHSVDTTSVVCLNLTKSV